MSADRLTFLESNCRVTSNSLHPVCNWLLLQTFMYWCRLYVSDWRSSRPTALPGNSETLLQGCITDRQSAYKRCWVWLQRENSTALRRELSTRWEFHHVKATSWGKQGDTCGSDGSGPRFLLLIFPEPCNCLIFIIECYFLVKKSWKVVIELSELGKNLKACSPISLKMYQDMVYSDGLLYYFKTWIAVGLEGHKDPSTPSGSAPPIQHTALYNSIRHGSYKVLYM